MPTAHLPSAPGWAPSTQGSLGHFLWDTSCFPLGGGLCYLASLGHGPGHPSHTLLFCSVQALLLPQVLLVLTFILGHHHHYNVSLGCCTYQSSKYPSQAAITGIPPAKEEIRAQQTHVTCSRSHSSRKVWRDLDLHLPANRQGSERWGCREEASGGEETWGGVRVDGVGPVWPWVGRSLGSRRAPFFPYHSTSFGSSKWSRTLLQNDRVRDGALQRKPRLVG